MCTVRSSDVRKWIVFAWVALLCAGCSVSGRNATPSDTLRIVFGSCLQHPSDELFEVIRQKQPTALLLLGDNLYLDDRHFGSEERILEAYAAHYGGAAFRALRKEAAIYAIWDDHDYGPDNANRFFDGAEASKRAFRRVWSQNPAPPKGLEESIAFRADLPGITILATDNRTFREAPGAGSVGQYFGPTQLDWLERELKHPSAPLIALASGNQVLATSGSHESLREYPDELRRLLDAITRSPAKVVVLSGDLHHAEILELHGTERLVVELTSSPFAGTMRQIDRQDAARTFAYDGGPSFMMLTVQPDEGVAVQLFDYHGRLIMERSLF